LNIIELNKQKMTIKVDTHYNLSLLIVYIFIKNILFDFGICKVFKNNIFFYPK